MQNTYKVQLDVDCRAAQRRVRAAEQRFRCTRSDVDRRAWTDKLKALRVLYEEKNNSYWRGEIAASGGNSKKLWRTFNSVLDDDRTKETSELSADELATFFQDKVDSVRSSTESTPRCPVPVDADT